MFKNLFDLSVKRSGLNALGFYIVYTLLGGIFCGLFCSAIAVVYCMLNPVMCSANGADVGLRIGKTFGVLGAGVVTLAIGIALLTMKKLWKSVPAVLLFLASLPASLVFGCMVSMILLSIITTFGDKLEMKDNEKPRQESKNENPPQ